VLEARYHVVRYQVGARWGDPSEALDPKYRQLSPPVRVTEEVAAFARKAVGKATRPVDVGRKIYDAMIDMLTYDKEIKGCGIGDTAWLMKYKRGKCDDYHALFMAAMVSQGIPVRWEQGFPLPYPSETEVTSGQLNGDCSGAHCWASFYDPEMGWVPVDVSEADKRPELHDFFFGNLTPNRFKISEGRAIFLTPRQGGQPLSTFAFAYAEADGIPLIYLANYENIIQFNITHIDTV
jgi:transglutaminase-like putative cysteine protease